MIALILAYCATAAVLGYMVWTVGEEGDARVFWPLVLSAVIALAVFPIVF